MPKQLAWAAAAVLLITQAFLSAVAFDRLSTGQSYSVEPFRPVIDATSLKGLSVGDRILRANGREVRGRQDLGAAASELQVRGSSGERTIKLPAPSHSGGSPASWFAFLLWPAICSLLAVAVLFWNGESQRAWTGAFALAGLAQTQAAVVHATDFDGALRWWVAAAFALLPLLGLVCVFRIAMNWPRRWRDSPAGRSIRIAVYAIIGAYGALRFAAEVAALADYGATAALVPVSSLYRLLTIGLAIGAAVALALRSLNWNTEPYTGEEALTARILKFGSWIFCGGTGALLALAPLLSSTGMLGILEHPASWLPMLVSLALPAAIAITASRKEEKVALAAPPPVDANTWQELREGIASALPAAAGLRLLALYGKVGEAYCVRWSIEGVRSWEPLGAEDFPEPTRDIIWLEMPLEDRPRAGWMVFLSEDVTGRPGEAVVRTLEKLARAAAPVAARL